MITYKANKLVMITITHTSYGIRFYDSKKNYCVLKGIYTEVTIEYIYTVRTVYCGIHTFDRLIKLEFYASLGRGVCLNFTQNSQNGKGVSGSLL